MEDGYDGPTDAQLDEVETAALLFFPDHRPKFQERFAVVLLRGGRIAMPVADVLWEDDGDVIAEVVQE